MIDDVTLAMWSSPSLLPLLLLLLLLNDRPRLAAAKANYKRPTMVPRCLLAAKTSDGSNG